MRPIGDYLSGPTRPRNDNDPAEIEHYFGERPAHILPSRIRADLEYAKLEGDTGLVRKLERDLDLAEWRERLQASRPAGCWCLGIGGHGRVAFPAGDDEPLLYWRVWCSCPEAEQQRADVVVRRQAIDQATRQRVIDRLFGSLPGGDWRDWTLDTLGQQSSVHLRLAQRLRDWLDEDRWLFLYGPVSRGKSGAAVGVTKLLAERGQTALYADTSELLRRLRQYGNQQALAEANDFAWEGLRMVDVLLLDDLGAERHRDGEDSWATEQIWLLISDRHRERRRTVITSNYTLEGLAERLGHPRISARIEERSLSIDFTKLPNLRTGGKRAPGA